MELDYLRNVIPMEKLHVYELDEATNIAFKSLSTQSFDILHVSSHAFYNTNKSRSDSNSDLVSSIKGESVMDNCGIKLTGYNDDGNKGIITATEIASLDLSNVSLVILSACETGTGDTRGGDIYSLAEAFHLAGVRYVMATTSEVEDEDACNVFIRFINDVINGESYHDAFCSAIQTSKSPEKYILWE